MINARNISLVICSQWKFYSHQLLENRTKVMKVSIPLISWLSGWYTRCFLVCICKLAEIGSNLHLQEIMRNKLTSQLHNVAIAVMVWNPWHLSEMCFLLMMNQGNSGKSECSELDVKSLTSGYLFWCSDTWQLSYLFSANPSAPSLFWGQNSANLVFCMITIWVSSTISQFWQFHAVLILSREMHSQVFRVHCFLNSCTLCGPT